MKRYVFFFAFVLGFVFSVFGQSVSFDEIRDFARGGGRRFATLRINTKLYQRDSSNGDWFDGIRNSGNPAIVIQRTSGQRNVVNATLLNEYRFEATFYNAQNNLVITNEVVLQFLDSLVVSAGNVPFLVESQFDRRRAVNEPSGRYTLREFAGAYGASDGANLFISWYENTSAGIY